jgi:hypothetical protein
MSLGCRSPTRAARRSRIEPLSSERAGFCSTKMSSALWLADSKPLFPSDRTKAPYSRGRRPFLSLSRSLLGKRCDLLVSIGDLQHRTFRLWIADELRANTSFLRAQPPMLRIIGQGNGPARRHALRLPQRSRGRFARPDRGRLPATTSRAPSPSQ